MTSAEETNKASQQKIEKAQNLINLLLKDRADKEQLLQEATEKAKKLDHYEQMGKVERLQSIFLTLRGIMASGVSSGTPIAITDAIILGKDRAWDRLAKKARAVVERYHKGERTIPVGQIGAGEPLIDETTGIPWRYFENNGTLRKQPMSWIAADFYIIAAVKEQPADLIKITVSGKHNKKEFAKTFVSPEPGVYDFDLTMKKGQDDKITLSVPKNFTAKRNEEVTPTALEQLLDRWSLHLSEITEQLLSSNGDDDKYKPHLIKAVFSGVGDRVWDNPGGRNKMMFLSSAELKIEEDKTRVGVFIPEDMKIDWGVGSLVYVAGTFSLGKGDYAGRVSGNSSIVIPSVHSHKKEVVEEMYEEASYDASYEDIEATPETIVPKKPETLDVTTSSEEDEFAGEPLAKEPVVSKTEEKKPDIDTLIRQKRGYMDKVTLLANGTGHDVDKTVEIIKAKYKELGGFVNLDDIFKIVEKQLRERMKQHSAAKTKSLEVEKEQKTASDLF